MRRTLLAALAVASLFLAGARSARADVTVGLPADPGGNCFPFGCAYLGEYQQVYSHTQFTWTYQNHGFGFLQHRA